LMMTEEEFLAFTGPPVSLFDFIQGKTDRKLAFFACACCRRVWPLMTDERSRRAVDVAERKADGLAGKIEVEVSQAEARAAIPTLNRFRGLTVGIRPWRDARDIRSVTRAALGDYLRAE
jgi:hypothetical protein